MNIYEGTECCVKSTGMGSRMHQDLLKCGFSLPLHMHKLQQIRSLSGWGTAPLYDWRLHSKIALQSTSFKALNEYCAVKLIFRTRSSTMQESLTPLNKHQQKCSSVWPEQKCLNFETLPWVVIANDQKAEAWMAVCEIRVKFILFY